MYTILNFGGNLVSNFLKKHVLEVSSVPVFLAKKQLTWWTLQIELFSIIGDHGNSNSLRYAPENKSSPSLVTGKWLLKN